MVEAIICSVHVETEWIRRVEKKNLKVLIFFYLKYIVGSGCCEKVHIYTNINGRMSKPYGQFCGYINSFGCYVGYVSFYQHYLLCITILIQ